MATDNGNRGKNHLTHVQFFQVCEVLRKNRDWFFANRPTEAAAGVELSRLLGFNVAGTSISGVKEATGITWEPKRGGTNSKPNSVRRNSIRTLTVCLMRLYRKLGEEVPDILQALRDYEDKKTQAPDEGGAA